MFYFFQKYKHYHIFTEWRKERKDSSDYYLHSKLLYLRPYSMLTLLEFHSVYSVYLKNCTYEVIQQIYYTLQHLIIILRLYSPLRAWAQKLTDGWLAFQLSTDREKRSSDRLWGDVWSSCRVPQPFLSFQTRITSYVSNYANSSRCWVDTGPTNRGMNPGRCLRGCDYASSMQR